ncbi:MAG: hypothetical protein ACREC6_12175 [Hyphomicrobiaceae bacterium]
MATLSLVADITRALSGPKAALFTSIGQYWTTFSPKSLAAAQTTVKTFLHPLLWDVGIKSMLALPLWMPFGILGLFLAYIGRQRRRVNIFTN